MQITKHSAKVKFHFIYIIFICGQQFEQELMMTFSTKNSVNFYFLFISKHNLNDIFFSR